MARALQSTRDVVVHHSPGRVVHAALLLALLLSLGWVSDSSSARAQTRPLPRAQRAEPERRTPLRLLPAALILLALAAGAQRRRDP